MTDTLAPVEADFYPWPKIHRISSAMTITEKIDGTNAAIVIRSLTDSWLAASCETIVFGPDGNLGVRAQSRKRIITPDQDNFEFAKWVWENSAVLARDLGPGVHFGEWWGKGIQRSYGLDERRFSLFNVERWQGDVLSYNVQAIGVRTVPVLDRRDTFDTNAVEEAMDFLREEGSVASPGFDRPEGVVAYFHPARWMFKKTFEGDVSKYLLEKNGEAA